MKKTRLLSMVLVVILITLSFSSCAEKTTTQPATSTVSNAVVTNQDRLQPSSKAYGFQLDQPKAGEQVAVLHTNYGDIFIRLFPDEAPKAVENFIGHINSGYYNGLIFHRVIKGFCVQGGDPEGNGTGGESIWGKNFEDEFSDKLLNITYSVAMANSGANTNGSQFFINHSTTKTLDRTLYDYETQYSNLQATYQQYAMYYQDFKTYYPTVESFIEENLTVDSRLVPEEVWKLYEANGGNINLDGAWRQAGGHTVFGQVYMGQEVVDEITEVAVGENDKPLNDVVIESAEVITVS